jgi:hypothetical protein
MSVKGGVKLCCEEKKIKKNYAVFYFAGIFFYIFMKSLLHRKKENAPLFTTCMSMSMHARTLMFTIHPPSSKVLVISTLIHALSILLMIHPLVFVA